MVDPYLGIGHTLYADNYYSSVPLTFELVKRNINFVGQSVRTKKVCPCSTGILRKEYVDHMKQGRDNVK